jgi:hypothetical protein
LGHYIASTHGTAQLFALVDFSLVSERAAFELDVAPITLNGRQCIGKTSGLQYLEQPPLSGFALSSPIIRCVCLVEIF